MRAASPLVVGVEVEAAKDEEQGVAQRVDASDHLAARQGPPAGGGRGGAVTDAQFLGANAQASTELLRTSGALFIAGYFALSPATPTKRSTR